jgi:hypothetical protein
VREIFERSDESFFGIEVGGRTKAYPLRVLFENQIETIKRRSDCRRFRPYSAAAYVLERGINGRPSFFRDFKNASSKTRSEGRWNRGLGAQPTPNGPTLDCRGTMISFKRAWFTFHNSTTAE